MGSIYGGTVRKRRAVSNRQQNYFRSKTTDRKVVKHELVVTVQACQWLREVLPGVHFRTDTASGAFNSEHEKQLHMSQQSSDSEPDITILAARRGYHGLVIELKADGVELKMQRNGTKIRVKRKRVPMSKKHPEGWKIVERDYKVRMKGDWANLHVEKQALCLEDYNKQGYLGRFCIGLEGFKRLVCWYFDIEYIAPPQNLELPF